MQIRVTLAQSEMRGTRCEWAFRDKSNVALMVGIN